MSVASAALKSDEPPLPRGFHWLTVADVRRETEEATSIAFDVPDDLAGTFSFIQGQYLTLLADIEGETLRRPYSICVAPGSGELRVCVRKMPRGRFSGFVNDALKIGDALAVMRPGGRFHMPIEPDVAHTYVGIAGGSGITPVMSIIRTVLDEEPASTFTLFYGNRTARSVIFRGALADLKDTFMTRLRVFHMLSDEARDIPLFTGVLDQEKVRDLCTSLIDPASIDGFFICGPGPMMDGAAAALNELGVPGARVKIESFGAATPASPPAAATARAANRDIPAATATLIIAGEQQIIDVPYDGSVLNAALAAHLDMPFACKGGVCCTCKAKLLEGEVRMDVNFGLEADEIAAGYILTCQSHPRTEKLVIEYD